MPLGSVLTGGVRIALPPAIDPAMLAGHDPAAPLVVLEGETMGTTWQVRFAHPSSLDPATLRSAIVARLDGLVAEMSHWAPASLLSRFNRAPADSWIALPPDFAQVMAIGLQIARATNGAFDPAIGRLVDLWGHGPPGPMPIPDDAAVEQARAVSGWHRLAWDGAARRLRQPGGVALDLSGIAKGHAVDALVALLRVNGVHHALVEVGGELSGLGLRPDGDPWWADLETPPGLSFPPLRVALCGVAVATSGDYVRGRHTLDPRTGRPVAHGVVAVSVIHEQAMQADGWATALTVLGPDAPAAAAAHRLAVRILTVDEHGAREWLSPALAAMLAD